MLLQLRIVHSNQAVRRPAANAAYHTLAGSREKGRGRGGGRWERDGRTKRDREKNKGKEGEKKGQNERKLKKCLVLTVKHFLIAMAVADNDLDLADGPIQMEYNV